MNLKPKEIFGIGRKYLCVLCAKIFDFVKILSRKVLFRIPRFIFVTFAIILASLMVVILLQKASHDKALAGTPCTWNNGNSTGIWNDAGNWSCANVPNATNDVILDNTSDNNLTVDIAASVESFTINSTYDGIVSLSNSLTTSGAFDQDGGTFTTNNNTLSLGSANITGGTFNAGSSNISVSGDYTADTGTTLNAGSSTTTISGNLTVTNGAIEEGTSTYIMDVAGKTFTGNWSGGYETLYDLQFSDNINFEGSAHITGTLTIDSGKTLDIKENAVVMMDDGSTTTITGTITKDDSDDYGGLLELYGSAGANLSTSGTLSSVVRFVTNTSDVTVPERTYGARVEFYNNYDGTDNTVTVGTAVSQTLIFRDNLRFHCLGTGNLTVDFATYNPDITVDGKIYSDDWGTGNVGVEMGDGTWTLDGKYTLEDGGVTDAGSSSLIMKGLDWSQISSGMSGGDFGITIIYALEVYNGELYAAGNFHTAGGNSADYIAKWDGTSWSAVGGGFDDQVFDLEVYDSKLFATGRFTQAGGGAASYIASWNGSAWSAVGTGLDDIGQTLSTYGGDLIAGGNFHNAGGGGANHIAEWDGANWSALGVGTNDSVLALTTYGGNLIAGGAFTQAGGGAANLVAEWDGANWAALGTGISTGVRVEALEVYGGNLIAGGRFTQAGGNPADNIAEWDGANWAELGNGADNDVHALTLFRGNLIAGGAFYDVDNDSKRMNAVGQWDGANWSWLKGGVNNTVYSFTSFNGELVTGGIFNTVGGYFTSTGGTSANTIATYGFADLNPGEVNNLTIRNTSSYGQGVNFTNNITLRGDLQVQANGNANETIRATYQNPIVSIEKTVDYTGVGAGSEALVASGSFWQFLDDVDFSGGTVEAGTSTFYFGKNGGTQSIKPNGQTFYNVEFNDAGFGATFVPDSALDINGTFTLTDGDLDLDTNDPNVNIAGDITIDGGSISTGSGTVVFDGDLIYDDNVGGVNFGNIEIGTSPDTTDLLSDLTCSSLTINAGDTLNTNGYDIDCSGSITINGTGTLNATNGAGGATQINLGGSWSNSGTFTKDTSTVILDGTGAQSFTAGGTGAGKQFNNLIVSNGSVAGVTFNDSVTATGTFRAETASTKMTFNAGSTYAFTNISLNGQAKTSRIIMQSSVASTDWLFNVSGTQTVSYVEPSDSDASGGNTILANNGTNDDAGGNHNWDFGPYRYWVSAGSSNWNNSSNWATASGGTGGASVPGGTTPVIFDGGGVGDSGIDVAASVQTVNIQSGYSGTITINASQSLTTSSSFTLADGTFNSNGQNLTIASYSQTNGTFTAGASAITCTGAFAITGGTYNANTSTLTEDVTNAGATTTFDIRGFSLNNVLFRSNSAVSDKTVQFVGGLSSTDTFNGYVRLEAANTRNITLDGDNVDTINVNGNFEFVGVGAGNEIFYPNSSRYWYFGGNLDIYNGTLNSTGSTATYIFNSSSAQTLKQNNADTGRFYSVQVENTSVSGLQILNTLNTDQIYLYATGASNVTLDATAVGAPDNINIYGNIAGGGPGGGSKIIKAGSASWNVNYYNLNFTTFTLQSGTSLFTFDTTTGFNGTINPGSNHFYDIYFKGDVTKAWTLSGNLYATRNFTTDINFDVSASNYALEIGGSFTSGNNHFVERSGTVTFDATATGKVITMQNDSFYDVVFNGIGGGWTLNSGAGNNLSVSRNLTMQNGTFDSVAGHTVTVSGTYSQSGGIFNTDASTVSLYTYAQTGGSFNANSATLSITATYSQSVGTFNAPTGTLNLYDSFTRTSGTFNNNGGTVKFTVNKSMSISTANVSFNHLEITRTAGAVGHILTFQDGFTVEGNLTVKNEYSTGLDVYGSSTPTIQVNGNLSLPSTAQTGSLIFGSSPTNNFTTRVKGNLSLDDSGGRISSNITLNATTANQTVAINAGSVWGSSWVIDNSGFSALMSTALNLQSSGNLTVTSGTLNMQNYDLTVVQAYSQGGGTFEGGSGTLSIGNTFGLTNGTFNGGSGDMTVGGAFSMSVGTFNAKSGNTSVSGAFTISSGSFVHSGGTVTLTGTVSRTITTGGATFSNLNFGVNTNATTLADSFIVSGDLTHSGNATINNPAVARTITLQGNFNKTGSGSLGGNNLTIDMTGTSKSFSTSLGAFGSILKLSGTSLTVGQSGGTFNTTSQVNVVGTASASTDLSLDLMQVTSGSFDLLNRNLNLADDFTQNGGVFNAGSGTMTLSTGTAFTISSGIFNSPVNLTANATAETFALSGGTFNAPSGTLTLKGTFTRAGANTFNHNSGLVKFITNASHNVTSANAVYNNVEFNRESGAVTHTLTLQDGFSAAGTLTAKNDYSTGLNIYATGTPTITVTGALDIPSTAQTGTLAFGGTGVSIFSVNVAGNVSVADSNATVNANINLNNTSADQSITHSNGTIQTGTWTITKGSYVANLASNLTLTSSGKVTISTGVLYTAGYNLSVASTFNNNATLRVQGGETLTFTAGKDTDSGTVEYIGDGGATSYPSLNYGNGYYHLRFNSTSGNNSFSPNGAMTVNGNLTLDSGTLDMAAQNMNISGSVSNNATLRIVGSETMTGFVGDADSGLTIYYGSGSYGNWSAGGTYFNLQFTSTGTYPAPATVDINGYLTLGGASLDLSTNSTHMSVAGNVTVNSGSVTPGSGQTHFDGDLTYDDNVGGINFGNLVVGASPDTTDLSSDLTCTSLTVNAGDTLNTHGYDIDCSDGITINGTGTLNATDDVEGDTTMINLGGSWSNSGTFTKDTSTVTLDGAAAQSVTAGGTGAGKQFTNLIQTNASVAGVTFADSATVTGTWTNTTASSKVTFDDGSTYAFTNINLAGTGGNEIILVSSNPGNQWFFNVSQASPTANYVDVEDSDANGGSMIDARIGGIDSGNNENWLFAGNIIISGRVYTNEAKSGDIGAGKTMALSVNGAVKTTVDTIAGGNFSFINIAVNANDTLTIFIDDETEKANLVSQTVDNSSNVTGLEMYTDKIVLRHESAGPMTNTLLAIADNCGDADIHFSVAAGNATFDSSYEVWIDSAKNYTPGGTVTSDKFYLTGTGTFNPAANNITFHGKFRASAGSTLTTSGLATFDGSASQEITSGGKSFYNVTITNTSAGGVQPTDSFAATGYLYLNAAGASSVKLDASVYNPSVTVGGDFDYTGVGAGSESIVMGSNTWTVSGHFDVRNGSITCNTSALVLNGTSKYMYGNNQTYYNLQISGTIAVSGTPFVPNVDDVNVTGTLTVDPTKTLAMELNKQVEMKDGAITTLNGTINGPGRFWLEDGAGANLSTGGTLNAYTIFVTVTKNVTAPARNYGNAMAFQNTTAGTYTATVGTAPGQTFNISGPGQYGFQVRTEAGVGTLNVDASVYNPTINTSSLNFYGFLGTKNLKMGSGTWTLTDQLDLRYGNVDAGTSAVVMTGDFDPWTRTIDGNNQTLYDLRISGNSPVWSDFAISNSLTVDVNKTFYILNGEVVTMNAGSTTTLNGYVSDGRLDLVDSAGANLSTGGKIFSTARFVTAAANAVVPARTFNGNVELYNSTGTPRTVTLGTAPAQSLTVSGDFNPMAEGAGNLNVDLNTNNPNLTIYGNLDFAGAGGGTESLTLGSGALSVHSNIDLSNGTITAGSSTVNMDGAAWADFGGANSEVRAMTVYNGELVVGGWFTTAGGNPANYIAKWDGVSWTALGSGMDSSVEALVVYGGNLIAGGNFTSAGGGGANYIASWNGANWSALGSGMDGTVYALTVFGANLVAGGSFTTAGGGGANNIASWNGANWSALGSGTDNTVLALTTYGGNLIAGGNFTNAGGGGANYIASWNGANWSALGSGMDDYVAALTTYGGNLIAGGFFSSAGGSTVNQIASWNGANWSALGTGMDGGTTYGQTAPYAVYVNDLVVNNNELIAGGSFEQAGSVTAKKVARWNGSAWSELGSGMDYDVNALAIFNSELYAGGLFTSAGGQAASYLAKASNANLTSNSQSFNNLNFKNNTGFKHTAAPLDNLTVAGNLTVEAAGDGNMILDASTANPTVNVTGNLDFVGVGSGSESIFMGSNTWTVSGNVDFSDGTVLAGSSTLVMDGTVKTLSGNSQALNNLSIAGTITASGSDTSVSGTLTVDPTKILTIDTNRAVRMSNGATTTINGTVTGAGRLELVDGAGANLSTGGTLTSVARFTTSTAGVTVPARTYGGSVEFYNVTATSRAATLGTGGGQTIIFQSNFYPIADALGNITVDASANNPTINISGNLDYMGTGGGTEIIQAGSGNWTVTGNINLTDGTLTAGTSTFIVNGSGAQSITSAANSYNNLTDTNASGAGLTFADGATVTGTYTETTPSSRVTFAAGSTFAFANINLTGLLGSNIIWRSSSPGSQWFFNVTQLSPTAHFVDVQDSNASGGNTIIATDNCTDSGNNVNWLFGGAITISGTVYTNEAKSGNIGPGKKIGLSVNGAAKQIETTGGGGQFTFTSVGVLVNDTITLFVDDEVEKANLVSQTGGTDMTGLEMYTDKIVIRHETAGPMTNTLLATAAASGDGDIQWSVVAGNATFNNGFELWLDNNKSYTPGGQVTADDLELRPSSTFTPAANNLILHGSFKAASNSTFTTSGTTTFDANSGTNTIESGTKSFYNLTFNDSGGTATYRPVDNLDVNRFFTLTDGILDLATNNPNVNLAGNITVNGGSVSAGSGTVRFDGDLTYADNVGGTNFGNIAIGNSPDTTTLATDLTCSLLTINAGDVLNTAGYDISSSGNITISSTGTLNATSGAGGDTLVNIGGNWSNLGILTASTSTVDFNGGGAQTLNSGGTGTGKPFNHLTHSGAGTLQLITNNISVQGNLTISGGTLNANSLNITVYRNWANSSTFTPGTGTVSFRGTAQSDLTGPTTFYNLVIDTNADGAKTIRFESAQTQTITNLLYMTGRAGKVLTIRATTDGNQGRLSIPSSMDVCVDYIDVKDNRINGTNTIRTGNNSVDSGNNTNWIFGGGYDCFVPNNPTSLLQLKTDNSIIPAGGATDETTVKFNAFASDNDPADSLSLCVEVKPLGDSFANVNDNCGTAESYTGTPVSVFASISGLSFGSNYHWQARVKDATNQYSGWVAYGSGSTRDFGVESPPSPTPTPEPTPEPTTTARPGPRPSPSVSPAPTSTETAVTGGIISPTPSPKASPTATAAAPSVLAEEMNRSPLKTILLLGTLLAVAIPQVMAAIASIPSLLSFFGNLFEKLGSRFGYLWSLMPWYKKRPAWGVVYDGQTKKPIADAAVRIYTVNDNRLRETQYTNKNGGFGFLVEAGVYTITVVKTGYQFPSALVKGAADGIYQNLYHGGEITVKENAIEGEQRAVISVNIPLDSSTAVQTDVSMAGFLRGVSNFFNYIRLPLMILGTILTAYLVISFGGVLNYIFMVIYILLWVLEIYLALRPRTFGAVADRKGKPLELVLIRAMDAEGRVSGSVVTGRDGRFHLNLNPGLYRFVAAKIGFRSAQTKLIQIRRAADLGRVNIYMEQIGEETSATQTQDIPKSQY